MRFESFIGNKRVKEQLSVLLESNRFPHALIIEGEEGLGKRTLAKEIALSLICISEEERPCRKCAQCKKVLKNVHPDVCIYKPDESKKSRPFSVDTVRDIINDASIKPNEAQFKIYILEECERMNASAQNALLKIIEEPPSYAVFILCASSKAAMLPTVLSRSVVVSLEGVENSEGAEYICEKNSDIDYESALHAISVCSGNIGKAIQMLGDGKLGKIIEISNSVANALIQDKEYELIKALSVFEKDNQTMISCLEFLKSIFRDALLYSSGADMISNQKETVKRLAQNLTTGKLIKLIGVCDEISLYANGNGNNALLITKLCYELRRAQKR
ncbi:MAG: hypothetical protein E7570_02850 [Ruminococcaceae bacterium]|nr:hypothetical protein [Oscillospiraceae bacterium]